MGSPLQMSTSVLEGVKESILVWVNYDLKGRVQQEIRKFEYRLSKVGKPRGREIFK